MQLNTLLCPKPKLISRAPLNASLWLQTRLEQKTLRGTKLIMQTKTQNAQTNLQPTQRLWVCSTNGYIILRYFFFFLFFLLYQHLVFHDQRPHCSLEVIYKLYIRKKHIPPNEPIAKLRTKNEKVATVHNEVRPLPDPLPIKIAIHPHSRRPQPIPINFSIPHL